jgi:hypothetical protein
MNTVHIVHSNGIEMISGSDLNFLYFNARSLKTSFEEINNFLTSLRKTIHLIIITETWLKSNDAQYYNFCGFVGFHSTRESSRGGGVAIYVNRNFDCANELGKKDWNGNNCLLIELIREKTKIGVFYRQPNGTTDPTGSNFIEDLNSFLGSCKNAFLFGDFNFNLFHSSALIERYKDIVTLNNFQFLNSSSSDFPTRINYSTKSFSCIDHIFTDHFDNPDFNQFTISYFDLVADHKALCLTISKQNQVTSSTSSNFFKMVNHSKILSEKLIEQLIPDNFEKLVEDISDLISSNSIKVKFNNGFRKPYISKEIFKFILIKRNFEKLKKKYPLSTYVNEKWKFYRNKVSNLSIKAKKSYFDNFFATNASNPKKVWSKINECLGKKVRKDCEEIAALNYNGFLVTDKKLIANALNNYQVNVSLNATQNCKISQSDRIIFHSSETIDISEPFTSPLCTEDEIKFIISRLKNSNAQDYYYVSNSFVKKHARALAPILARLITKQIELGEFPDCLKIAVVKPIYKNKGSKLETKNYRPISILPIFSKIFESVIYRRVYDHCQANNFLNEDQFGYTEKSGTEAAMLHTLNDIYQALDHKKRTALLTLDLSCAFDCLNHEILLIKLGKLMFSENFYKLLKSYLTNRKQLVKVDNTFSSKLDIFCGAPQGGVLSGLFFNIYVNSIFNLPLCNKLRLFCDDMSIIASGNDNQHLKLRLENDLRHIDQWLDLHYLRANYDKTNYILFNSKKKFESFTDQALNISIRDTEIQRVDVVKIVGLFVDEQLNFSKHIELVKNRLNPFISKLFYIKRFISNETALKLYYTHVHCHLTFMNALWSVAPNYLFDSLGVIQRRALRIVLGKDRLSSSRELFSVNILPLSYVSTFHECLLIFKILQGKLKNNVQLVSISMRHDKNTRSKSHLIPIEARSSQAQKNFYCRAIRTYNDLPLEIKKFNSLNLFKTRLKEHLFDVYCCEQH